MTEEIKQPKVFISYSWSSVHHQEMVKLWADRLIHDGVDVILDIYDLNEGDNKFAFMESMVTDPDVTHVLVVCDSKYKERADAREKGVGTESTIISSKVYAQVKQSKFIPILCEFEESGEPIAPVFMDARIGVNFSTPESVNENWEQLIRLLYSKPLHVKPKKGAAPSYITSDTPLPANEARAKFESLKQAVLQDKKGLRMYRQDFIDSCMSYADELRIRESPSLDDFGQKVLDDCAKLKAVRNHLCDWVLLEGSVTQEAEFTEVLIDVLEKLYELKSRPEEVSSWNDAWSEAHSVFVYETFLYIVAALMKVGCYRVLHEVYTTSYINPPTVRNHNYEFEAFSCFHGHSETLQSVLRPNDRLYSPEAELIKEHADRQDITFQNVAQAEALTLMMALLLGVHWYPGTLHYAASYQSMPFFVRATQHKHFANLATITDIATGEEMREKFKAALDASSLNRSGAFFRMNFSTLMNLDKLDTIK
ncbi:SEFIR domain-containing protein [Vibrio diabolicus]|uniref:SEFIR domain-containing protein n=1 Tax=Vibrio diabolicus TaxID=50719 RepID=UPI002940BC5B|nr:SEFIR domain-containing protein [Vibrio diabolicus]MDV5087084.1 SEFIR domain-containing protein [Vibrio diabolicus]